MNIKSMFTWTENFLDTLAERMMWKAKVRKRKTRNYTFVGHTCTC